MVAPWASDSRLTSSALHVLELPQPDSRRQVDPAMRRLGAIGADAW